MKCLLIFDHLNDIIYTKYNEKFASHINRFATETGLLPPENPEDFIENEVDPNIIVQIFSPIITSQRIMSCQFGNSYTSIQCQQNLNLCFDEYMGYLFVVIGSNEDVSSLKRFLNVSVTIVRYFCGPDVIRLHTKPNVSEIVTKILNGWSELQQNNQAVLVEAVEQLVVNTDVSTMAIQALRESVEKLTGKIACNKLHALLMVQNKFLSLYSSQNAKELSAADIIFVTLLANGVHSADGISSFKVLLAGAEFHPKCLPYIIHIIPIYESVHLIYFLEVGNPAIASSIYETFVHLHTMQLVQIQREADVIRPAVENLDIATKRLQDSLKKTKNVQIETCYKALIKKWEVVRKKYLEFVKNGSEEAVLRAETLCLGLFENLKLLLSLTDVNDCTTENVEEVSSVAGTVKEKLGSFMDFLKAKAIKNFSLGSYSLTINKYLEEFPGLVHFLYVDRTNHRLTAPTLDFDSEETNALTKTKIWQMVNFSRNHLQEGNLSLMWKDTIFNYTYFVWFEDSSGAPLKPTVSPTSVSKPLPLPGLLCTDFYHKLKEVCFPKMSPTKVRCYELFCIHLGLVTASCVLEHTRRLAATIWELRGLPSHPIDLF